MDEPTNPIELYFWLFFLIITIGIFGYIGLQYIGHLPSAFNNLPFVNNFIVVKNFYTNTFNFIDDGIIFVVIFIFIVYIGASYFSPSKLKAIFSFLVILLLGALDLGFTVAYSVLANALPAVNTIEPLTTSLFSSPYFVLILYFSLIISIILNLRSRD